MKKKYSATAKDKKEWISFTRHMVGISAKEADFINQDIKTNKIRKLDLHGFSLVEANKMVEKFIIESFNQEYKKLLIITGKGTRSKTHDNPYFSKQLSVLKYSIPEYIKNNENLNNKISRISKTDFKKGGDGAIYIFLKNTKKFIE